MRIDEAKAALERAGYRVDLGAETGTYEVGGIGLDALVLTGVTEDQLIGLAHRHGRWKPAFEGQHTAGPFTR